MFLTDEPNSIEDFLKAVKFIAPKGMNLKYFVVPTNRDSEELRTAASSGGYAAQPAEIKSNVDNVPGVTDTIVYRKPDTAEKQSVSASDIDVTSVPNNYPITKAPVAPVAGVATPMDAQNNAIQPVKTDILISGGEIMNPGAGVKIIESTNRFTDIILEESVGPFPKYTVLHFVKESI